MVDVPFDPITEADLHGYVDGQLPASRHLDVERHLAARPDDAARVRAWQAQAGALRRLFDPVLQEPMPVRLVRPLATRSMPWRSLAAGSAVALASASVAWIARGEFDSAPTSIAFVDTLARDAPADAALAGYARRAAVAHAVYAADLRRPVEVGAEQKQQLLTWLSTRLGMPLTLPRLRAVGYEFIGGRLLPGEAGPVAQFMYHDALGHRLTLYVTREVPKVPQPPQTDFRFGREGPVNVLYWMEGRFGCAVSGDFDRSDLLRVAQEVQHKFAPD